MIREKKRLMGKEVENGEDVKSGTVLVSNKSTLVAVLINENDPSNFLVTIDSESLLKVWSVYTNQTTTSYKIGIDKRIC